MLKKVFSDCSKAKCFIEKDLILFCNFVAFFVKSEDVFCNEHLLLFLTLIKSARFKNLRISKRIFTLFGVNYSDLFRFKGSWRSLSVLNERE